MVSYVNEGGGGAYLCGYYVISPASEAFTEMSSIKERWNHDFYNGLFWIITITMLMQKSQFLLLKIAEVNDCALSCTFLYKYQEE